MDIICQYKVSVTRQLSESLQYNVTHTNQFNVSSKYDVRDLRIYRSTDGGAYTLLDQVPFNQGTYDDTTTQVGHTYCYYVKKYDKPQSTWVAGQNESCKTTINILDCNYEVVFNGQKSFSLQYNTCDLRIYRKTDGESYSLLDQVPLNQNIYIDNTTQTDHIYCYYVKGYDNSQYIWLDGSNESCVSTKTILDCNYEVVFGRTKYISSKYEVPSDNQVDVSLQYNIGKQFYINSQYKVSVQRQFTKSSQYKAKHTNQFNISSQYDVRDLRIYRNKDGGDYSLIDQIPFNQGSYVDTNVDYNHTYCYYVKYMVIRNHFHGVVHQIHHVYRL